jgi:signal recognition particle receptor subunit beta
LESIQEALKELQNDLNEPEFHNTILLIYANKQGLPGAMSTDKVSDILGLGDLKDRIWHIQVRSFCAGR